MKRYKISKQHSKNLFQKGYNQVKAINIALKPQRGGYRI